MATILPSWVGFMATLIFDIETSALPPESFDEVQNEYLFRDAARLEDLVEREKRRAELQSMMSLWPFTSRVVCIAMLNADTARGQVLFTADDYEEEEGAEAGP